MIPVVHLITSLEVGGAQRMLQKLLARVDHQRFPSRVLSLVDGGRIGDEIREQGVEVGSLGMRRGLPDPRAVGRLARRLRARQPAILQCWLYHAEVLGLLAGRRAGVPQILWNLRGTALQPDCRSMLHALTVRVCARLSSRPDVVLTNSRAAMAEHLRLGYRPRRWEWIPNGFDLERLQPRTDAGPALRRELGLPDETLLAGCFARWHPMKDHAGLLAAFGRLQPAPGLHLLLAGAGLDRGNPALAALLADCPAAERVHLLGARADVPRLMAGVDFLVSSSRCGEGFPNVLGEAMACATPCVTTDSGDSAYVVGETGLVVPAGDPEALADAIRTIADLSPQRRAALGGRARERIAGEFRMEDVARRYQALYAELGEQQPCAA